MIGRLQEKMNTCITTIAVQKLPMLGETSQRQDGLPACESKFILPLSEHCKNIHVTSGRLWFYKAICFLLWSDTFNGGPAHWIHQNYVCAPQVTFHCPTEPDFSPLSKKCCNPKETKGSVCMADSNRKKDDLISKGLYFRYIYITVSVIYNQLEHMYSITLYITSNNVKRLQH